LKPRAPLGELWENYIVTERYKRQEYLRQTTNAYFWRTYDRKEIDLVEEGRGKLSGYEIKWRDVPVKIPRDWSTGYPAAGFSVIHRENYLEFIGRTPALTSKV
jgi:hypothetical protein